MEQLIHNKIIRVKSSSSKGLSSWDCSERSINCATLTRIACLERRSRSRTELYATATERRRG